MKTFSLPFLSLCLLFTTGCSGYSRLPKIDFIGKSREEVIRIFAQNPEKAWGTHINICTPLSEKQPYHCGNNRYFTTLEEALADEQLKKAPALRGYRTGGVLPFPPDGIIIKLFLTKTTSLFHRRHIRCLTVLDNESEKNFCGHPNSNSCRVKRFLN